ncbi:hypothetical protein DRE_04918 [Drechslerella stenobrocha 248]|uniref:Tetrapyrrole biosynthesis uroporphyrinogen III synthase domain-containing protein n=1 Tax=Drechslerella stenobrocha 248 TaxID=1043628 RepID=W7HP81_9PEZI|nr:hypothetical protein DRE_04918 [Drechslerella stenobrocha 248]
MLEDVVSSPLRKTPVLLLKTASSADPYSSLLSSTGAYTPIFIPVLQHYSVNADVVKTLILEGAVGAADDISHGRFGALVITSQRAVEALGAVLEGLKETDADTRAAFLSSTRIYVVGPATRTALVNLGFTATNVIGEESGNGAVLTDFIVGDCVSRGDNRHMLLLVGETHSTVIPTRVPEKFRELTGVDMHVEEVVVYHTNVVEAFEGEFRAQLDRLDEGGEGAKVRWVVVFSPTGAGAALKVLKEREGDGRVNRICTIGPTTRDFLWQKFQRLPDAVAKSPSPEGLLAAIELDSSSSRTAGQD